MKFKFHLYIQKHANQTYTVTPIPFYDLTAYGASLDEVKAELSEAIVERVEGMPATMLQQIEFDPKVALRKVQIEMRPVDRKNRKKRREQIHLLFSLIVKPDEDNQLLVTVPRVGTPPLTFYAYTWDELDETARVEIMSWLDES